MEFFQRCVVIIYYGDDKLALFCGSPTPADDIITVANVGVDHTVASDLEGECIVVNAEIGVQGQVISVVNCLERRAGRHNSAKRNARSVGGSACRGCGSIWPFA